MKYSIITINYNNRDGLLNTIESVIKQTFKDFEFIVIDGGSTDGSVDVIKNYQHNITYWVSEKDDGIYNAMNKGVNAAHGEYLSFMNSGDMMYDSKVLEKSLPYLHADFVHGIAENLYSPVATLCLIEVPNRKELFSPTLHHQACLFRKSLFYNTMYDEHYRIVSDWKFYIEQLLIYNCSFCRMPVKVAMCEGGGLSEKAMELGIKERIDVLEKMVKVLKERNTYKRQECLMLHLMFTCKQRLLIDKSIRDIDRYINTFPEANNYYKYYPFSRKQRLLFYLAEKRMTSLLKVITKLWN